MKEITFLAYISKTGRKERDGRVLGIPKDIVTLMKLKKDMMIYATLGEFKLCKKLYASGSRNHLVIRIPPKIVKHLQICRKPLVNVTIEKVETSLLERILS